MPGLDQVWVMTVIRKSGATFRVTPQVRNGVPQQGDELRIADQQGKPITVRIVASQHERAKKPALPTWRIEAIQI